MNSIERFKAVVHFKTPDYVPIFGLHGAPGMSYQPNEKDTVSQLLATGLPPHVLTSQTTWEQYWGVQMPIRLAFFPAEPAPGIRSSSRIEGDFEIIEYETGALTRQVIDNDLVYSMPDFHTYHVRDRESWEIYKACMTPGPLWHMDQIHEACRPYFERDRPLSISLGTTWGGLRSIMGAEKACTILYDDPELAHEIIEWQNEIMRTYRLPLVELLRPEIVVTGEDMCYNHGSFISPALFEEYCAPTYREIAAVVRGCSVDLAAVDCDGNVMELVSWLADCGINGLFPFEVKAGNDLFALRERHPDFIFMGWLEKEILNQGNESLIESEILSKVPHLIRSGGYFPNGDHGLQPLLTYSNLCRFMTVLHDVTRNPEGVFPRV